MPRPVPLHVFIGYADLPAFRGATSSVGEALRSCARKVDVRPLLWHFEQLTSAHWRERAWDAAMEADIVVLASSSPEAMTTGVEQWVSAFLNRCHGRRTTLVVITSPNDAWTISLEQPRRIAVAAIAADEPDVRRSLVA